MSEDPTPTWLDLERLLSLKEAANVSSLSKDSLKRNHADKIIRLGPRRLGMRARDALMLGKHVMLVMFVVALAAHAATASAPMPHTTDNTAILPFIAESSELARQAERQDTEAEAAATCLRSGGSARVSSNSCRHPDDGSAGALLSNARNCKFALAPPVQGVCLLKFQARFAAKREPTDFVREFRGLSGTAKQKLDRWEIGGPSVHAGVLGRARQKPNLRRRSKEHQPASDGDTEGSPLRRVQVRRRRDEIEFFKIAEVAERLSVSARTVRRWIAAGDLVAHRRGGVVRIAEGDLRAFLALYRDS
jgi:excisionase family DNA binding protein